MGIKINRYKAIRFIIFFNFLFPSFNSFFSNSGFGVGYAIINFVITFICVFSIFSGRGVPSSNIVVMAMTFFSLFFVLIALSVIFSPNRLIYRDLFEFHRPFYYGSMFILPLTIRWDKETLVRYVIRPIIICFVLQIIFGLVTVSGIDLVREVRGLYTKSGNISTRRATGTFLNPYDYGFMMVFIMIYFMNLFFSTKRKVFFFILSIIAILSILVSQSRTAAIVAVAAVIYFVFLLLVTDKDVYYRVKTGILGLSLGAILYGFSDRILGYIEKNYGYLSFGIKSFLKQGIGGNNSIRVRFEQLTWALAELEKSPFIGLGPGKGVQEFLEMQYSLYLYRYGLFGLLIVMAYFSYSFFISYKTLIYVKKNGFELKITTFFLSFHVWCAMLMIASFGNGFIDITRISLFFFLLNGVCTSLLCSKHTSKGEMKHVE